MSIVLVEMEGLEPAFRAGGLGGLRPPIPSPILPPVTAPAVGLLAELERPPLDRAAPSPPPDSPPERRSLGPVKLNYTHEDCIDAILANPTISQNELATRYGYTQSWISLIINSDAFQAALAKRRDEVLSPELKATVEERFRALITESQRVLLESLHSKTCPPNLALGTLQVASKAMGYGAREQNITVNQQFVVELPPSSKNSEEWTRGRTIEGETQRP